MSNVHTRDTCAAFETIRQLKARYFRLLDTKQWAALREIFTTDFVFFFETNSEKPTLTSADAFITMLQERIATAVTVHHGHMPEISIQGPDRAIGIWAMEDWVDDPDHGRAFHGFGHYHETYRMVDGDWRIAEMRLTRLRVDELEPGRAGTRGTPPPVPADATKPGRGA